MGQGSRQHEKVGGSSAGVRSSTAARLAAAAGIMPMPLSSTRIQRYWSLSSHVETVILGR